MAKKKTVTELRSEAEALINKAKEIEKDENATIGKYIRDVALKGFKIDYDTLKQELNNRFALSTGNQSKKVSIDNKLDTTAQ